MDIKYVRLEDLQAFPGNPKDHDIGVIHVSIFGSAELGIPPLGFNDPVGIREGVIIEGHGRTQCLSMAMQKRLPPPANIRVDKDGMWLVPTIELDHLDAAGAERYVVVHNQATIAGGFDSAKLATVLMKVRSTGHLEQTGFDDDDLKSMLSRLKIDAGKEDDDEEAAKSLSRAEELQQLWGTEAGQLWIAKTPYGAHWLLIGSSLDEACVDRVMDGVSADMIWTDPPYGVAYEGKTKDKLTINNDALGFEETQAFLEDAIAVWPLRPGGVYYVCAPAGDMETAFRFALVKAAALKYVLKQCLVWVKQHFVMGRMDYHWQHESIFYGHRGGATRYFVDDRTQSTVWNVDRPMRNIEHPTMKPVALVKRAIANSTQIGNIIFDGFAGSGSVAIAAHHLERSTRMIELSPAYGAVILERLKNNGLKPELVTEDEPATAAAVSRI